MEGKQIQGEYTCRSNNTNANSDSGTGGSAGGTTSGGSEGAAGIVSVNTAVLSLAIVGGLAQLLL